MAWDDELEDLISKTLHRFGQDVLENAATRALQTVMATIPPRRPIDEMRDARTLFPPGVLEDALKVELRKLFHEH